MKLWSLFQDSERELDLINRILTLFLAGILIVCQASAFSAEAGLDQTGKPYSLNALIDETLKNNPQIRAAKQRYEAAKARVKLLRTLEDPKFEYEYDKITADMDAVMRGKTAPMRTFSISQELPFPTKLILRKQSAQKEANSFEQEYKETERKIIKDLKEAYFQLFLSKKKILVTKENLNLLKQVIQIANGKYSVGKANQQDVLKAQVEHSKLSNQLILMEQEEKIAGAMLNSILNRPVDSSVEIPQENKEMQLELTEEKVIKLTKENRAELKSFQEMLRKSEIDYSLAKQEYLPDFMLKYKRQERDGGTGSWAAMFGVSIPLWFWEKQDSFVKEAGANLEVVKAEFQAQENMVLFESRSSYVKFEAAKNLVRFYETGVLPQAQAALNTSMLGYQADKIDFLDLLDSQRSLLEFQMEYFESQANLEISLADLERSVGMELAGVK